MGSRGYSWSSLSAAESAVRGLDALKGGWSMGEQDSSEGLALYWPPQNSRPWYFHKRVPHFDTCHPTMVVKARGTSKTGSAAVCLPCQCHSECRSFSAKLGHGEFANPLERHYRRTPAFVAQGKDEAFGYKEVFIFLTTPHDGS